MPRIQVLDGEDEIVGFFDTETEAELIEYHDEPFLNESLFRLRAGQWVLWLNFVDEPLSLSGTMISSSEAARWCIEHQLPVPIELESAAVSGGGFESQTEASSSSAVGSIADSCSQEDVDALRKIRAAISRFRAHTIDTEDFLESQYGASLVGSLLVAQDALGLMTQFVIDVSLNTIDDAKRVPGKSAAVLSFIAEKMLIECQRLEIDGYANRLLGLFEPEFLNLDGFCVIVRDAFCDESFEPDISTTPIANDTSVTPSQIREAWIVHNGVCLEAVLEAVRSVIGMLQVGFLAGLDGLDRIHHPDRTIGDDAELFTEADGQNESVLPVRATEPEDTKILAFLRTEEAIDEKSGQRKRKIHSAVESVESLKDGFKDRLSAMKSAGWLDGTTNKGPACKWWITGDGQEEFKNRNP